MGCLELNKTHNDWQPPDKEANTFRNIKLCFISKNEVAFSSFVLWFFGRRKVVWRDGDDAVVDGEEERLVVGRDPGAEHDIHSGTEIELFGFFVSGYCWKRKRFDICR